uniref:Putative secreted protein n=1 Tax=Ixodes ricinus TaxID=34613 RepID=A0A147BEZ2_IXORI
MNGGCLGLPRDLYGVSVMLLGLVAFVAASDCQGHNPPVGLLGECARHERQQESVIVVTGEAKLGDVVDEEVELGEARPKALLNEPCKMSGGLAFRAAQEERLLHKVHGIGAHSGDTRSHHQLEEGHKYVAVTTNNVECLTTQVDEHLKLLAGFLASVDHVHHVGSKYERGPVTLEVDKHLRITKELSKVNVKHVSGGLQHDIVVVPIADAEDVGGDAVTGT